MGACAVVGLQWGDEGKGKVIDWLAPQCDLVVRAQGGHNSGHTVVSGGREWHFHLLPSALLHPRVTCYLGGGVVIDPAALRREMATLEREGITLRGRFFLSRYAHLIFPHHVSLDTWREGQLRPLGTTGRGIGPCYEDKVGRRGIRVGEWIDTDLFPRYLREIYAAQRMLRAPDAPPLPPYERLLREYEEHARCLAPYVTCVEENLEKELRAGKTLLLEGAQGALLDVHFGTYPFVTSSSTSSAALAMGAGVAPTHITRVVGVVKAYATRVGEGPFPTECTSQERACLGSCEAIGELGTTTGRPRRIGWLDIPLLKSAIARNGVTTLALTKLDILDAVEKIKICVGYRGLSSVPLAAQRWEEVEPHYTTHPGWQCATRAIKKREDLPKAARALVDYIEELTGLPIGWISVGPDREETIGTL